MRFRILIAAIIAATLLTPAHAGAGEATLARVFTPSELGALYPTVVEGTGQGFILTDDAYGDLDCSAETQTREGVKIQVRNFIAPNPLGSVTYYFKAVLAPVEPQGFGPHPVMLGVSTTRTSSDLCGAGGVQANISGQMYQSFQIPST